jgi:hypothetical protein
VGFITAHLQSARFLSALVHGRRSVHVPELVSILVINSKLPKTTCHHHKNLSHRKSRTVIIIIRMSLPNNNNNDGGDDHDDHYTAHRLMMKGGGGGGGILRSPSSEDETAAETSVGSNSVVSGAPSTVVTVPEDRRNLNRVGMGSGRGGVGGPSSLIVTASAATGPVTAALLHRTTDIPTQRRRYLRQLQTMGLATGATVAISAMIVIPTPLLIAMIVLIGIFTVLIQTMIQVATYELQLLMQGRGIGDYLPTSLYEQLTQRSIHDFMSDRSMVDENAYMMLYFLPGLSRDQIDEYVGRLAPRHQHLLHRQGLGFLLGETFMRFLVGDQRIRRPTTVGLEAVEGVDETGSVASPVVPRRLELPPTIPEEGVADDTSELGEEEDPATQYARFWGVEPGTATGVSISAIPAAAAAHTTTSGRVNSDVASVVGREVSVSVPVPSSRSTNRVGDVQNATTITTTASSVPPTEEDSAAIARAEEQVIYDAIGTSIATYMGVAANMVHTSARQSATLFSGTVFRASLGVTMVSVGVGLYGFWTGAYHPQTFFQPTLRMLQSQIGSLLRPPRSILPFQGGWNALPSSEVLIASTAASGATASIMFLFQMGSRRKDEQEKERAAKAAAAATHKGK